MKEVKRMDCPNCKTEMVEKENDLVLYRKYYKSYFCESCKCVVAIYLKDGEREEKVPKVV